MINLISMYIYLLLVLSLWRTLPSTVTAWDVAEGSPGLDGTGLSFQPRQLLSQFAKVEMRCGDGKRRDLLHSEVVEEPLKTRGKKMTLGQAQTVPF